MELCKMVLMARLADSPVRESIISSVACAQSYEKSKELRGVLDKLNQFFSDPQKLFLNPVEEDIVKTFNRMLPFELHLLYTVFKDSLELGPWRKLTNNIRFRRLMYNNELHLIELFDYSVAGRTGSVTVAGWYLTPDQFINFVLDKLGGSKDE